MAKSDWVDDGAQSSDWVDDAQLNVAPIKQEDQSFMQRLGSDFDTRINKAAALRSNPNMTEAEKRIGYAGQGIGMGADVIKQGINTAIKPVVGAYNLLPDVVKKGVGAVGDVLMETPIFTGVRDTVKMASDIYGEFEKENPRLANPLNVAGNMADFGLGLTMVKPAASVAVKIPAAIKSTARISKLGAQEISNIAKDVSGIVTGKSGYEKLGDYVVGQTRQAGIIPKSIRGYEDIENFKSKIKEIVPVITKEKNNLQFVDKDGVLVKGALPQTVEEMSQVIQPLKDKIMAETMADLKKAGESGFVSQKPLVNAIDEIMKTPEYKVMQGKPEYKPVLDKLEQQKKWYEANPNLTPLEANADIKTLNTLISNKADTLSDVFYIHLVKAQRKVLDNFMNSIGLPGFQEKKKLWGALKEVEPRIAQRANQLSNVPKKLGYWNMATLAEGIAGIATHSMPITAAAAATRGVAKFTQWHKSPNRAIKNMFEKTEGTLNKPGYQSETFRRLSGESKFDLNAQHLPIPPDPLIGDVSGMRPTPLSLPMPERGFTMQGTPYGEVLRPVRKTGNVIDAEFTSQIRPALDSPRTDPTLFLPGGQGFNTGEIIPNVSRTKLKGTWNDLDEEDYLKGLRNTNRYIRR